MPTYGHHMLSSTAGSLAHEACGEPLTGVALLVWIDLRCGGCMVGNGSTALSSCSTPCMAMHRSSTPCTGAFQHRGDRKKDRPWRLLHGLSCRHSLLNSQAIWLS